MPITPLGLLGLNSVTVDPGNGGNPITSTDLTPPVVAVPVLNVTKKASTNTIYVGETFNYTITITNVSTVPTMNPFTVTDALPAGLSLNGTPTSTAGAVTNVGDASNLDLSVAGIVAPGGTVTITIPVIVGSDATLGPMSVNQVTVDPGNGGNPSVTTDSTPPNLDIPELVVTKTSSKSEVIPVADNQFDYVLMITNNGTASTANPYTISDALPTNVTLAGAITSSDGSVVTNTGTATQLNLSIAGTVAQGGAVSLTIPVSIADNTPVGTLPSNVATVDPGNGGSPVTGTDKNPPNVYAPVVIGSKVASVSNTFYGEIFYYTLTLTNSGTAPTENPFTFEEFLPAGVELAGAITSNSGTITPLSNNIYQVNSALEPGQSMIITIPVATSHSAQLGTLPPNTVSVLPEPNNPNNETTVTEVTPPVLNPPVITVTKAASNTQLYPGDSFNYLITIENTGLSPTANPFTLTDNLPTGVTLIGMPTSTAGIVTNTGSDSQLNLSIAGIVDSGATVTVTLPVYLATNVAAGDILANSATVNPGFGGSPATGTEITPPTVTIPPFIVNKLSDVEAVTPGASFNYVITITNNTNVPTANPFAVTDTLPLYLSQSGDITSPIGIVTNTGTDTQLDLSVAGVIPPGASETMTIPVQVSPFAPIGPLDDNIVVVDPGNGNNPSTGIDKSPPVIYAPILEVEKQSSVSTITPGSNFTYLIGIKNTGNYPTTDPLLLSDLLPDNVSLTGPPTALYGTVENTGTNQNVQLVYSPGLSVSSSVIISLPVTVSPNAPSGPLSANTINIVPGNGGNPTTTDEISPPTVVAPQVTITKVASTGVVYPGETYYYTLNITNISTVSTSNPFVVTDYLPTGVTLNGPAVAADGTLVNTSGTTQVPVFSVHRPLAPDDSILLKIPATVTNDGSITSVAKNVATVDPGNGGAVAMATENTPPTLQIPVPVVIKTSSEAALLPGDAFTYTLTLTNNGAVAFSNPFTITDTLPEYVSLNGRITSTIGTVINNGDAANLNLSIAGTVLPGNKETISIPVILAPDTPLDYSPVNVTTVDPGNGGNPVEGLDKFPPVTQYPFLSVTKTADVTTLTPCDTFNYLLTVTNTGNIYTTVPLYITDTLPPFVTLAAQVSSNSGTVTNYGNGSQLNLQVNTSLPPNGAVTITIPVVLDCNAPAGQLATNTANIWTSNTNQTDVSEANPPIVDRAIFDNGEKSACPETVCPGDVITYTIVTTNTGDAPCTNFSITDTLPSIKLTTGETVVPQISPKFVKGYLDGRPINVEISGTAERPIFTFKDKQSQPFSVGVNETVYLIFSITIPPCACAPQTIVNQGMIKDGAPISDSGVDIICC